MSGRPSAPAGPVQRAGIERRCRGGEADEVGGSMGKEFDVVVVGGRCAGSPLAALLARGGLSVALVEQATFPRDTLSTHTFQSSALTFLNRLGVLSAVLATGAPVVNHLDIRQEEFRARVPWPHWPGEAGGLLSVRRLLLDPILMEAARD